MGEAIKRLRARADGEGNGGHVIIKKAELGALLDIAEAAQVGLALLDHVEVFVKSRERINRPTGEELFDKEREQLRAALSKLEANND